MEMEMDDVVNVKTRKKVQSKKRGVKNGRVSLRGKKIKKMKQEKKKRGNKVNRLHPKHQNPSQDQCLLQNIFVV